MAVLDYSYTNLKQIAIEKCKSGNCNTDINCLKEVFASDINSPRCLSRISDLASLITILEKRDVLSPVSIGAFDLIFNALQISSVFLDSHRDLIKTDNDCLYTRKYEDEISNGPSHDLPGLNNLGPNNYGLNIETSSMNGVVLSNRGPGYLRSKYLLNRKSNPTENQHSCLIHAPTMKPIGQTHHKHKRKRKNSTPSKISYKQICSFLKNKLLINSSKIILFFCDWLLYILIGVTENVFKMLTLFITFLRVLTPGFFAIASIINPENIYKMLILLIKFIRVLTPGFLAIVSVINTILICIVKIFCNLIREDTNCCIMNHAVIRRYANQFTANKRCSEYQGNFRSCLPDPDIEFWRTNQRIKFEMNYRTQQNILLIQTNFLSGKTIYDYVGMKKNILN